MIKIALSTALCAVLASASTTMCFKKDQMDPSTIETVALDGGECQGMFSVSDMKKQGYNVDDIKITVGAAGMNYMYVFSKQNVIIGNANTKAPAGTQVLTKEQLKSYLSELKEEEIKEQKRKEEMGDIALGKDIYTSQCISCHGEKGELKAYNKSRPLNSLTYQDMETAIADFEYLKKATTTQNIMKPYASGLTEAKLKGIVTYLRSLK